MAELVFDVGMHNGDDTAQYLASGYDVVAIEANPSLCEAAQARFAAEIAAGRLTIRNVGVSDKAGRLTFWISENLEWSSFGRDRAARNGASVEPLDVSVVRFSDLVNEYRKPLYVKIDVEGSDTQCVEELQHCRSLPDYVSLELPASAAEIADSARTLVKLGYDAFKCIRQNDWSPVTADNLRRYVTSRRVLGHLYPIYQRVPGSLRDRLGGAYNSQRGTGEERYAAASSGPLAREIPGRWMSSEEAIEVAVRCQGLETVPGARRLPLDWFDLHARHAGVGGPLLPVDGHRGTRHA